ncbi:hypothetical protein [Gordonia pseudamarae]|jgi:hypothetical protein|uniref:Uncharacterized protein n=1 Tax=Gordonia pseudamarae TaxID=2831662 RepID=A0ABX6IMF1_9ACTN|nr:hypothetical protein [Gordonia pseudamarae]QHN36871.1 hypothetical protein GII31_20195 [Gordonia pseudamarae]
MTTVLCDPWIERHISAGRLSPGARGMSREDAASQYNECNGLVRSDEDFLYTPTQAATTVRELLSDIGIEIHADARILLTDGDGGQRCWTFLVEPSQLEYACEQHRYITGESINADALEGALPWG